MGQRRCIRDLEQRVGRPDAAAKLLQAVRELDEIGRREQVRLGDLEKRRACRRGAGIAGTMVGQGAHTRTMGHAYA